MRSGFAVDQFAVAHLVSSLLEQTQALAQVLAHGFRTAADGIGIDRREDFRRHFGSDRLEDFQFFALRQAARSQLGAIEIAADALVLVKENLLVHLLEIEREIERAAHPRIPELV